MKHLFVIILFLIMFSCQPKNFGEKDNVIPTDSIISKEVLVECMTDIFLIEAAIFKAQTDGKDVQRLSRLYYDKFFKTYSVSKEKIRMSIEYYIRKKQIEAIVQEVVARLTEIDSQTQTPPQSQEVQQPNKMPSWLEQQLLN